MQNIVRMKIFETPKTTNGLIQMIKVDKSTGKEKGLNCPFDCCTFLFLAHLDESTMRAYVVTLVFISESSLDVLVKDSYGMG